MGREKIGKKDKGQGREDREKMAKAIGQEVDRRMSTGWRKQGTRDR